MKGLLIGGSIVLGLILGFWPGGLSRPKPAWWRWLTIVSILALFILALGTPTGGDFSSAMTVTMSRGDEHPQPIHGRVESIDGDDAIVFADMSGNKERVTGAKPIIDAGQVKPGTEAILELSFSRADRAFRFHSLASVDPWLTLPLIPGLEERARNLYFHVPSAWLAQLAWFIAFGYAVLSLKKRRLEDDIRATAAAAVGAVFCILATVTGAVWAKFNWGVFWNWDPRQTSIFVVLVIYGAYFALRSAIQNDDQRARLSAVYLVLLMVPVIFFLFIFPRLVTGLHPGAADSGNAGPVISPQDDALNPTKQAIFALSWFSFTLLFFWIVNVVVRTGLAELRSRRRAIGREEGERSGPVPAISSGVIRQN